MELQTPIGKQRKFILTKPKRLNLLYGSWRSSKSVAVDFKWIKDIIELPPGNMIMVGNTINSLERNVLSVIKHMVGKNNFELRKQSKEVDIFDRTIWIEGADKEDAYKRIEGESLVAAYVDEWIHVPESFTKTLLSRMSDKDARAYFTFNPASPGHYVYRNYMARASDLDIAMWKFTLDDNPWLDPDYKRAIIAENPPGTIFYERNILGNWVASSGLVFANFDPGRHVSMPPTNMKPKELRVGVDYGTHNPTAFVSIEKYLIPGRKKPTWYATNEYYWDSTVMYEQKTDLDYSKDLASYLSGKWEQPDRLYPPQAQGNGDINRKHNKDYRNGNENRNENRNENENRDRRVESSSRQVESSSVSDTQMGTRAAARASLCGVTHPSSIEVDPSAASFILQLQRDGMRSARPADNDILSGIRRVASMIAAGELVLTPNVPWLLYTMGTYMWDPKAMNDEVIKEGDHPVDALRYVVNSL